VDIKLWTLVMPWWVQYKINLFLWLWMLGAGRSIVAESSIIAVLHSIIWFCWLAWLMNIGNAKLHEEKMVISDWLEAIPVVYAHLDRILMHDCWIKSSNYKFWTLILIIVIFCIYSKVMNSIDWFISFNECSQLHNEFFMWIDLLLLQHNQFL
jgi:hypothetical protein